MKANQLEISTRRRKWPTHFGLPVSLCVCLFFFLVEILRELSIVSSLTLLSLSCSLYRRRIPSGLLFVIHSINVCCLWDFFLLLFAVILCSFFVCIRRFGTIVLMFAFLFYTRQQLCSFHVLRLRPSGGEFRFTKTRVPAVTAPCVLQVYLCEFAQTFCYCESVY